MGLVMAVLLIGEALLTAAWLATRLPVLAIYGGTELLMIGLRALVAILLCAAASMWIRRLSPAPAFTRGAVLSSAGLLTLELGLRLAPTSLFPAFRWPVVMGYWVYALAVALASRHVGPSSGPHRPRSGA